MKYTGSLFEVYLEFLQLQLCNSNTIHGLYAFKFSLLIFLILGINIAAYTQELPYQLPRDTVEVEDRELQVEPEGYMTPLEREKYYTHSPRRASLYSAVLPGLGQAYNRKFWKIPILYVGAGVLVYSINWNHQQYVSLKSALFTYLNEGEDSGLVIIPGRLNPVPETNVRRGIDKYRRDRDYLIIISGLVYMLNIADAMVDAHLKGFDLGDDLTLKIKPKGGFTDNAEKYAGLSFTLKF